MGKYAGQILDPLLAASPNVSWRACRQLTLQHMNHITSGWHKLRTAFLLIELHLEWPKQSSAGDVQRKKGPRSLPISLPHWHLEEVEGKPPMLKGSLFFYPPNLFI